MHDETLVPGVELLESMRSVGYSFNAAASDIIDNSIAAGASQVEIFADSVDGEYLAFLDDGAGMSPTESREALKLAGTSNLDRGPKDLGRFGLGLKTASLSQGRKLTVLTKQGGTVTGLQWDLDHVLRTGSWSIRILEELDFRAIPCSDRLLARDRGTLVIWESLDYLISGASDVAAWMGAMLVELRSHLGLVFHRFLEAPVGLKLRVNGIGISPIDPFLERNPKTQIAPVENVFIGNEPVRVEAFTLPHVSGLTAEERKREDLGPRMRESQGFYVYRNLRLISAGGWFGLARLDELSKQTRVRVDIPASLDHQWQLDIKKSRVEPPQAFRQRFRQIIDQVKVPGTRVHRFRGRNERSTSFTLFWRLVEDRHGYRYEINSEHPAIGEIRAALPSESRSNFDDLLIDLAGTFPSGDLYIRLAENQKAQPHEYSNVTVLRRLREMRSHAPDADAALIAEALANRQPYNDVPNIRDLVLQVWKEEE